jgi:hypothetical protein
MQPDTVSAAEQIKQQNKEHIAQVQHVPGVSSLPRGLRSSILINKNFCKRGTFLTTPWNLKGTRYEL